jgi:hypothetical protein
MWLSSPAVATIAISIAVPLFLYLSRQWSQTFRRLGGVSLIGHILLGTVVLPHLPYSWDIRKFDRTASLILVGESTGASQTVEAFAGLQSVLYAVFSADPSTVAVFNAFCAVFLAIPAMSLARRLYPELETTRGLLLVVLFLPLPFLFQTIPMRDALSVLLFFSILAATASGYAGQGWHAVLAIPLWGALNLLRPELGAVLLLSAILGAIIKVSDMIAIRPLSIRGLVALAVPPGAMVLLVASPMIPVAAFATRLEGRATGGAAYLEEMTYSVGADVLIASLPRAIYFQYAPFPLHVTSMFDFIAVTMLPVLAVLTVAAYRSARECNRNVAVLVLLLTTYLLGIVGYGLIDSNFGTTVRHRIPFTFILCIIAAPTLERWKNLLVGPIGVGTTVDSTTGTERVGD